MNRAQVAGLLSFAAAFDKRTIGDADILAWHEVLDGLDFDTARDAVKRWYAGHREPIMPADIITGTKAIGDDPGRHPSARSTREALEAAERAHIADGGQPLAIDAPFDAERSKARLAEALDALAASRGIPTRKPTGYVPRRDRSHGRTSRAEHPPAPKGITICHRCVCDIPAPPGWDPANPAAGPVYCPQCEAIASDSREGAR